MKYVGIDVHKRMCQAAVLDGDGALLDEIARAFYGTSLLISRVSIAAIFHVFRLIQ